LLYLIVARQLRQATKQESSMTYEEFKTAYTNAFNSMAKYKVDEVGSSYFAEKMADLSDAYPEFEARLEAELEVA
jgi:hypothetical protein